MSNSRDKWNRIYQNRSDPSAANKLLTDYDFLLPKQGRCLDLACGLGANARFLYEKGLEVEAWDISDIALQQLQTNNPNIVIQQRDIENNPPEPNGYDVIIVTDFLYRPICSAISAALRPGGLLYYQTFCLDKLSDIGPSSPKFLLKTNELLELFNQLNVVFYSEFGHYGDSSQADRNKASLIAAKPITE